MSKMIPADASPEKQLFVLMITRDISLVAAFLDLIDNSINSAVEPFAGQLQTAQDFYTMLEDDNKTPMVDIRMNVNAECVVVKDTATGISTESAAKHVFKFGRDPGEPQNEKDRLSVYGIGLKRAMFKIGDHIRIVSDHAEGGFSLDLDVAEWLKESSTSWKFDIAPRPPARDGTGTTINVSKLKNDTMRRVADGVFVGQLRDSISKTYSFYISKFVNIYLNEELIPGMNIQIGENRASEEFSVDGVSCVITAGIGIPQGGAFRDRASGWFVFCNGRTVVSADKSPLTGWGGSPLPIFQPKHRPFLGTVFFVSSDPEKLPWNTTKSAIDESGSAATHGCSCAHCYFFLGRKIHGRGHGDCQFRASANRGSRYQRNCRCCSAEAVICTS